MTSPANHARDTIIAALEADAGVTALIPAASIYPNKLPGVVAKPYARLGPVDDRPIRASCWTGGAVSGALHVFVSQSNDIPDPESWAHDAGGAIKAVLEALPDCFVDRVLVEPDRSDNDVMHGIVFYRFDAVSDGT